MLDLDTSERKTAVMDCADRLLNLGCGNRFANSPEWVNVDFKANPPFVLGHDLTTGVPFDDNSFALVYHSHVLEHFTRRAGECFMRECFRVLKPHGLLRVAVPDLEGIVRQYLRILELVETGQQEIDNSLRYEFAVLEMYDQVIRERSGGDFPSFVRNCPAEVLDSVRERWGMEAEALISHVQNPPAHKRESLWKRLLSAATSSGRWRELAARAILGRADYANLQVGRFRRGGEIHQWMYDRYSLKQLLSRCGFINTQQCLASESNCRSWSKYNLDTEPDGKVYKPDSLFFEARKPPELADRD